jgi:hypothetical protein
MNQSNQNANQQQQNPSSQNYKYYPASYSYGDKADLLEKIKPDHIVHVIKFQLMGFKFEDNKWMPDPDLKSRSLTKIGATELASLMLPASSQNASISKLTDDEIRYRAKEIAIQAIKQCLDNWKIYGIRGRWQFGLIYQIMFTNTFITLKQAQDEGIRSLLKGTTSEVRTVNEQAGAGSFLANLFRRKQR